jgi:hypothetical protein
MMALISCPECGNEISDKAVSCPSCGVPISDDNKTSKDGPHISVTRTGAKWEGIGFLLIVGGMIYGMATGPENHAGGVAVGIGFILFLIGRFK